VIDILVVSIPSTGGWRAAAAELVAGLRRTGARVELVEAPKPPHVRTFALTDLTQAYGAHRATRAGLAEHRPRAVIYCSVTASLLWPVRGAIWFDSIAAENRPGRHGVWQRMVERRRLKDATLLLTMSPRSLDPLRGEHARAVVVPSPIAASPHAAADRDIAAIVYAGDPVKRRLDLVLNAWQQARRGDEQLVVAGTDSLPPHTKGVELAGRLKPDDYRALLRRARVFVAAPLREDYGIAPLEALADGCMLVTTPSPGPYPALQLARELDPRLVSDELVPAIRAALDDPLPGYSERAGELLEPFTRAAIDATLKRDVLPVLLPGWGTQ